MAKTFLTPINLNGLELQNARVQNLAVAPSHAVGRVYFDTALGHFRVSDGSSWTDLTAAQAGYTDEQAQDAIGAAIAAGTQTNITVTYNDAANSFSWAVAADGTAATPTLRTLGTGATQAAAGNDSRLSDARTPTAGSVVDASVSATAAIAESKLALASDAAAGVASRRTLGTGALQAAAGNDARLSDTRTPTAGSVVDASITSGGLSPSKITGTAVITTDSRLSDTRTPTAGSVVNASVSGSAAISADKLTDGATNVIMLATERAKLSGIATGATNYTNAMALANRLDQFAAPTASVSLNGQRITNLADPTSAQDAATKAYVDATATGLDVKASVRAATTANITLSGTQTIDGVALVAGDRVLVKNQTTSSANGIYVVAAGAWARATDADANNEVTGGMFTFVEEGTSQADTGWVMTTNGAITLGTTGLAFAQFSGAGTYVNGNGLSLTGSTFAVQPVASGGIAVGAGGVSLDTTVAVRKYASTIGDGAATSYVVTHNLGTQDVTVAKYYVASTYDEVECDVLHTSTNTITLVFGTAPAANSIRVVVHG